MITKRVDIAPQHDGIEFAVHIEDRYGETIDTYWWDHNEDHEELVDIFVEILESLNIKAYKTEIAIPEMHELDGQR